MRMYDIIQKKRDGFELTEEEIKFFINGYVNGTIPDYQASALAMAIYFRGMSDREITDLTLAMAHSGDVLDLSPVGGITVDKHSTGGVGDKTTLIVAPVVAALGLKVAKMSGRGLGHTGGTIDKLEAISGFRTTLEPDEFINQVRDIGISVIGQSGNLAPADKMLYGLRDVTATVDSIPLIASSIMSKKLAAGSRCMVFDVKTGSGAFMKTVESAVSLSEKMVNIAKTAGRKAAALITNMDIPLGKNIGNALEVEEAVKVLRGEIDNDLKQVSVALAATLVSIAKSIPVSQAENDVNEVIENGKAFAKLRDLVIHQGGDVSQIDDTQKLPKAGYCHEVVAPADGFIVHMDAEKIGVSSMLLGAGRETKNDKIDYAAGIVLAKKTGDCVKKGDILSYLYTNKKESVSPAEKEFLSAVKIDAEKPQEQPLIYKIVK